jgi:predicted nucleotidyltransferase
MTLEGGSASCKCIMALFGSVLREEFRADSDTGLCTITDLQATAEIVNAVHGFQVVESKDNQM